MSNKATKNARTRRNRRILIAAVAIFLVLISILAYIGSLHQTGSPTHVQPVADSSVYFAISDLAGTYQVSTGQTVNDSNPPSVVHISMFAFNFTPVGGDATNVRIFFPTGMQSPYTWEGKVIPRGTSTYTEEIQPPYAMTSARQKDGTYALKLRIVAEEADGYVTLNFTAGENLFGTG